MSNTKEYVSALFKAVELVTGQPLTPIVRQEVSPEEALKFLSDLLISSSSYPDDLLNIVDTINNLKPIKSNITSLSTVLSSSDLTFDLSNGAKAVIWQGDITTLQVSAIVNAANDKGLGCFEPSHHCIDNVIHRSSGPRLRMECKELMKNRGALVVGSRPIISRGFNLPSESVIHVTGPQLIGGESPTAEDEQLLRKTYTNVLNLASTNSLTSLSFCCISTGLFGYPSIPASKIAFRTVKEWFKENEETSLKTIVFNVFTEKDLEAYKSTLRELGNITTIPNNIKKASNYLLEATNVIICAGAGMSAKGSNSMENVYVDSTHFAHHYPFLLKYGFRSCYDCMGILGDPRVPENIKWTYFIKHYNNLQNNFAPNLGYAKLLELVSKKKSVVITSNIDSNFEQAGFKNVYTPQGSCKYYQCLRKCSSTSCWSTSEIFKDLIPIIKDGNMLDDSHIPKCRNCGEPCFINLRGGDFFLPSEESKSQALKFKTYVNSVIEKSVKGEKLTIIEIGAGFNTPTVTRYLVEDIVRECISRGGDVGFIRINPTESEVPEDFKEVGVGVRVGWEVLERFEEEWFEGVFEEETEGGEVVCFDWRRMVDALRR